MPTLTEPPPLLAGFNHVALVTRDLDRLTAFYRDVFGAPFEELSDPRGRHGFLHIGGAADGPGSVGGTDPILHVFEVPEELTGPFADPDTMFRRGRLDHFAIEARDEAALRVLRDRLMAVGACDGTVTVFGGWFLSLHVVDPDGLRLEVGCRRDGSAFADDELEAGA